MTMSCLSDVVVPPVNSTVVLSPEATDKALWDQLTIGIGIFLGILSRVNLWPLAVRELDSHAFSRSAWRLWAARNSQEEESPVLSAQPLRLGWVLELAASKATDSTFGHPGIVGSVLINFGNNMQVAQQ